MPAVFGAICSSIVCSQVGGNAVIADLHHGDLQWGYQLASLMVTLGMSIVGGLCCGALIYYLPIPGPKGVQLFDDSEYFELPDVFEAGVGPAETHMAQKVELQEPGRRSSFHPNADLNPDLLTTEEMREEGERDYVIDL